MDNKITIRTGGRGRPLEIDVVKTLAQYDGQIERAKSRLQELRRTTSGERSEAILGSETTLPKGISATRDVLEALQQGQKIDYETAKELRANLRAVKELASPQERVYGRALASSLLNKYEKEIERFSKYGSTQTEKTLKSMLAKTKALTPKSQQKFFLSRGYQSVATIYGNSPKGEKRHVEWAKNDYKKKTGIDAEFTPQEAFAYILEQKQAEELENLPF